MNQIMAARQALAISESNRIIQARIRRAERLADGGGFYIPNSDAEILAAPASNRWGNSCTLTRQEVMA